MTHLGTHASSVYNTLWDALTIELCKLLLLVEVLQQHRACSNMTIA